MTLTGPALAAYLEYKRMGGTMWLYNKMERNQMFGKFLAPRGFYLASSGKDFRIFAPKGMDMSPNKITGAVLAKFSNRARQRHKGPLVRFGRKYER